MRIARIKKYPILSCLLMCVLGAPYANGMSLGAGENDIWQDFDGTEAELTLPVVPVGLISLDEDYLGGVHAQGLFWTDYIKGNELAGANDFSTPFDFYRVGFDAELALNTNISKLQLGCGGVNDFINAKAGCDMDLEYVRMMGRDGANPDNPISAFVMTRPYLEFAIKNNGSATTREVVGMKIGAQMVDGALSAGRVYQPGQTNQENLDASSCTSASTGDGALGCHSGINSVSGFLGAEMSISMYVQSRVCLGGLLPDWLGGGCVGIPIPLNAWGCSGRTALPNDNCGMGKSEALFVDLAGTRMEGLGLKAALLNLNDGGILTDLIPQAYASLDADLRLVHKMTFEETGDFFISLQRQPVAYPRYSKMTPTAEMQANGSYENAFDACATTTYNSARCASAYAVPANTGWWLNAPSVKLLDVVNPSAQLPMLSTGNALSIENADFKLVGAKNCYGSTLFC